MNAHTLPDGITVRELVIDSFAGGGGASTGIRMALGRDADIAINHDPLALAMHRVNHPGTRHMVQDVATVDSVSMCAGLPIGMLWMSPDCTDHSKAKGAAPRRDGDRTTRGIGWAIVGWVKALPAWQRPRVVFLENVEEYVDWGPLLEDGKRCPVRKGETFRAFVAAWKALGYGKIEWRQRRAWWSGSGTIRRRLYMVMRRDGAPIVWPERTHGNPSDPEDAARIAAGELKPWVTAADSIDFTLPIPSIFDTAAEIRAKLGITAKRPLAPKTGARIAKGGRRYVLDSARSFLVRVDQTSAFARNGVHSVDEPVRTIHTVGSFAAVSPVIAYAQQGGGVRAPDQPIHTITASPKDQNVIIAPVLAGCSGRAGQSEPRPGDAPVLTQTAKADLCLVTPYLVPRYGEREGQQPRTYPCDKPGPTPVPTGNEGSVAAVHMMTMRNSGAPSSSADQPARTLVADGAAETVVAAMISRQFGASVGSEAGEPVSTVTAGGSGKTALVSAFIAQHNDGPRGGAPGRAADEPLSTITTTGAQQGLVAAHMLTLRGSDRRDAAAGEPLRTDSARGQHHAVVQLPMLTVYYGSEKDAARVDVPGRTDTVRDRFGLVSSVAAVPPFGPEHAARAREVADFLRGHGCWDGGDLVTVEIEGSTFVIVDICMRMLTPRERFNANGFPRGYVIDHGLDEAGRVLRFTQEQQGHMCGNAVCPTEAEALVRANYVPREVVVPRARAGRASGRGERRHEEAQPSFFQEAAE
ncbi:DNA cytosine methyltransferase [Xanthobacter aminoxidans]|uniref:DNA cytosine methyltransferase n=1 Tax=Xanthobacter aminoxidans TaxID=186280 RepID=UPI002022C392|nr:DNA cytosine methyltransferase [Xanthobacter aminoxidans]MCL8385550.1 DNA cytosine methyltransferase [Xanthobacter aminoxidans]